MAKHSDSRPQFTQAQRDILKNQGLIDEQIKELETILPLCRAWLRNLPTMTEVREGLRDLDKAISKTRRLISKAHNATQRTPGQNEILQRLFSADYEENHSLETISKTMETLAQMQSITNRALTDLPREQRRHTSANPYPVQCIDNALVKGFIKGGDPPFPPYTLKRSSSPNCPYRNIICICYEAMGFDNADPERAIRNFLKLKNST